MTNAKQLSLVDPTARCEAPENAMLKPLIHTLSLLIACSVFACGGDPGSLEPAASSFVQETPSARPEPSLALELRPDWKPPSPVRTPVRPTATRVQPTYASGVASQPISAAPSDEELWTRAPLPDPLVPTPGRSTAAETRALSSALEAYRIKGGGENIASLEAFLRTYPESRWAPSLLLNFGRIAYDTGYFSKALGFWKDAWDRSKDGQDEVSVRIANLALAEYAKMNARVGRKEELDRVFVLAQSRQFMGDARVKIGSALEGRWTMEHRPGVAFRCGPYALANIAPLLDPSAAARTETFLAQIESPPEGFSLNQVLAQSEDLGLHMQRAHREPASKVIVPAVVHWKVGHYGAIVRKEGDRYLVKDPTFGNQTWISARVLDEEASGFFLVAEGSLPEGWRPASIEESAQIFGRGHSGNTLPDGTGPDDLGTPPQCPDSPNQAMAWYRMHVLLASLSVSDTPIGYDAAAGPDVRIKVTYNQREASQPTSMTFTNFSPQWVSTWISYLEDDPSNSAANVLLRKRGGGGETHTGYSAATGAFVMQPKAGSRLYRLTPNTYRKVYPDGREEYYEQFIGTTGPARRVFLTRVRSPEGNEVVIEYDASYPSRIHRIIDATGLATNFSYDLASEPYLVTSIQDPFGRTATFSYLDVAGVIRLHSIEDVYGIVSQFIYQTNGDMASMSTPYGTTNFTTSPLKIGASYSLIRFIEAENPLGQRERVEYNLGSVQTGIPSSLNEPTPDPGMVAFVVGDNDDRNAFYWDAQQMKLAPGDYSKAHLYHFVQPNSADVATSILESQKPPLEGRIWYNYPGQPAPYIQGTLAKPSVVARVVYDETGAAATQARRYEYNTQGNLTRAIDPMGRETIIEYASNGVDRLRVKQKVGAGEETFLTYTYDPTDPPHLPRTVTDGAGQTTTYSYNAQGQITSVARPNGDMVMITYETDPTQNGYGRVTALTGDVPGGNVVVTYDGFDRVRTLSKIDGVTLTYDYDALDRITVISHADGSYEQLAYVDHSLVARRDREGRWTRHAYNRLQQQVLTRDPSGRQTQQLWCRCGDLAAMVDGNGSLTEWVRDEQGRVVTKRYADNSEIGYTYDFSGRLSAQTDPLGQVKTRTYFLDDHVKQVLYSDPDTANVSYTYDANYDRMSSRVDGQGTTTFSYNPNDGATLGPGRVAWENGPFADDTLKFAYDAGGQVTAVQIVDDSTMSSASYFESYAYDAQGRLLTVQNNVGQFSYAYVGQSSRVDHIDYPNGVRVEYDYYGSVEDNLLRQIRNLSAAPSRTVISQFDYTYNQDRTLDTWTIQQGASATTWKFGYDAAKQLTDAVRTDPVGNVLEEQHYAYDKASNRVHVAVGTTTVSVRNYTLNNLNQLIAERGFGPTPFVGFVDEPATVVVAGEPAIVRSTNGSAPYRFRAMVNLPIGASTVTVEATDGSGNTNIHTYAVTTTGTTTTYEYDANGNLRYEGAPGGVVNREYVWDQENRLARVIEGSRESQFDYDGASRRTRVTELENGVELGSRTFVWCNDKLCQSRVGSAIERDFFDLGFQGNGSSHYYLKDHLGSTREVVADDGSSVQSRYTYDPWGNVQVSGSGSESDFLFTGHYTHDPSGLALTRYRAYDARIGRWLSRDPMQEGDGPNMHAYVHNNPLLYVDPDGQGAILCTYFGITCSKDPNNGSEPPDPNSPEEPTGCTIPPPCDLDIRGLDLSNRVGVCTALWDHDRKICMAVQDPKIKQRCYINARNRWRRCMRANNKDRCLPPLF